MADLKKLLVIVRDGQHESFVTNYVTPGSSRKTDYDNKVVFLEKTQEIFTQGKLYGGGADLAALKTILADYGASGKRATTVAGDIDAMLAKLSTSNILTVSYNSATGQYDAQSYLGLQTNSTSYALEVTGYNGYVFGSVDVASNKGAFVEANNAYLTNVKGVTDYVKDQIGQLSGGMRYNGNTYTTTQTGTSYTIGYFPWNAATSSMKPGDTAIANVDFDILNTSNEVVYHVEAGDILIGKYPDPIEKQEGDDEHGIKLTGETLSYVTIIERETDTMVTASNEFAEADRVILSYNGKRDVKASSYTIGGAEIAVNPTASVLATEAAVATYTTNAASDAQANAYAYVASEIEKLDVASYTLSNNHVQFSYAQADGIVTVNGLTVTLNNPTWDATTHQVTIPDADGLLAKAAAVALNSYIAYVGNKLDTFNETITTVAAYTDATGTHYLTVTDNGTDNDHDYVINAYTKTLGSAVGMTFDNVNNVWRAADGNVTYDGLVTAYDVAKEIVDDEKIIAAALNAHETRIKACEAATGSDEDTAYGITSYVHSYAGAVDVVTLTINEANVTYNAGALNVGNIGYFVTGAGAQAIGTYAAALADAALVSSKNYTSNAIEELDANYTAGSDNAVNVSYTEVNGVITSVSATFNANNAVAYTVGSTTYSVADVATVVYDPWETFA